MKRYVITLRETPEREAACRKHLDDVAFHGVEFWYGVNAVKWGLMTRNTYDKDHPGTGFLMPMKHVGLHLSHWILWQKALDSGEELISIMEDDVALAGDWSPRLQQILSTAAQVTPDWDIIFLGSCHALNKPMTHIAGCLWDLRYPLCTHWYLVRRKALQPLIQTQEKSWAPIDLALVYESLPSLKVYTAIPRLASQNNIELPE